MEVRAEERSSPASCDRGDLIFWGRVGRPHLPYLDGSLLGRELGRDSVPPGAPDNHPFTRPCACRPDGLQSRLPEAAGRHSGTIGSPDHPRKWPTSLPRFYEDAPGLGRPC